MCGAFIPVCGYDNRNIIFIGDVYCPKTKCSGKLSRHKKLFNLSPKAIIDVRNARLCARCIIFLLNIQKILFSSFGQGVHLFEESPKSIQGFIGDVYCPGEYSLNRKKCDCLGCYVTTPRTVFGSEKCGAWLFVHKVLFMLKEHVTATKTDKTRFFFNKEMNLVPNKQLWINVSFQSTKYRKKRLCVNNKVQETLGYCFCSTCRNQKCVYISTNKTTSSYDCKKCKACCHVFKFIFKDQKPTIIIFGGDGLTCLHEARLRTTISIFEEFSEPITTKQIRTRTKEG